ncbi:hypothetical protein Tco_0609124 [Tanacetum coccineum]
MPKDNKTNLKRTTRISVRPCCFNNPRTSSPPCQPLSPPSDYVSGPPPTTLTSQTSILHVSPISNNDNLLLTPKSTPPPLSSPPPAPTQPSKLTSPLAINLDPNELLFSTLPTSPQSFLNSLEDLPPATTNPLPPHPSFDTIEHLANEPPPIPPIDSSFPSPTQNMEPPCGDRFAHLGLVLQTTLISIAEIIKNNNVVKKGSLNTSLHRIKHDIGTRNEKERVVQERETRERIERKKER